MKEPEMTIFALDSFDQELIDAPCIWARYDDADDSSWNGYVTTTPDGQGDAESLRIYAQKLVKKYPQLHISVHDGISSVSNYGAGVFAMAKRWGLNFD